MKLIIALLRALIEIPDKVRIIFSFSVAFICTQGAANRKMAATNMNTESSRSHCVFTCIVESKVSIPFVDSLVNKFSTSSRQVLDFRFLTYLSAGTETESMLHYPCSRYLGIQIFDDILLDCAEGI